MIFFLEIFISYPVELFERSFNDYEGYQKKEPAHLIFNPIFHNKIKNSLIIDPYTIPMVCEPKEWDDNNKGGYFLNMEGIIKDDLITGSKQHNHELLNKHNLYSSINLMSKVKFKINSNLLNFLENEGKFLINYKEMNSSEKLYFTSTIEIAKTFLNKIIYFPLQCDWRGRIYTKPFYIDYQGNDLSLSLLEFYNGEVLNKKGLDSLYIYGASVYNENNISKDSFEYRIKWVEENMINILEMKPEFMIKANDMFSFVAFCLTMKELNKDSNYLVKLPIWLDATCSGIQHLTAIIRDINLANHVNLIEQNEYSKPADLYNQIKEPLNSLIREEGMKENSSYPNLKNIELTRKIIKVLVMIKPYDAKILGMKENLENVLPKITKKGEDTEISINTKYIKKEIFWLAPSIIKGENIELNYLDLYKIAEIIYNSLFKFYPSLSLIYNYFKNWSKLLNKFGLPVIWITPAGTALSQSYNTCKEKKINTYFGGKRKKMVVKEYLNKLDKRKQIGSIIPNIIHSLDAAHLINIIISANKNNINPVITIHDCFGTTPNQLQNLTNIVKIEFIKLYSQENFLEIFYKRNKQNLIDNKINIHIDENKKFEYILIKRTKHYLPVIPKLGKLDLNNIIKSKYIIN